MSGYTYNQIVDIFRIFSENHSQINSFYSGDIAHLKGDIVYPLLVLNIPNTEFIPNQIEYSIDVLLVDRINAEKDNSDEVYSDCNQIIGDLVSYLRNSRVYDLIVDLNSNVQRVSDEVNSDWVSGWVLSLKMRTRYDYNICNIPGIIPAISFSGSTPQSVTSPTYLTCNTVLNCTSLQSALNTKANLSGATFNGNIFSPSITATTFYSGSTELSLLLGSGSSGENNTASNLGSGTGVFSNKSGVDLQFRSLSAGTGISISTGGTGNEIIINSLGGANADSAILVLASSTANIAGTYNNGSSGVGAVLSGSSNGTLANFDGISTPLGELVLLRNQTSALQNGIYQVDNRGSVSSRWVLSRYNLSDESSEFDPQLVFVTSGSTLKGNYYNQSTASPEVGTDSIVYDLLGTGSATLYVTQLTTGSQVNGQVPYWTGTARQLRRGSNTFVRNATTGNVGIFVSGSTPSPLSSLDVGASVGLGAITASSANRSFTFWDYMILADATSGNKIFTLPTASSCNRREYVIKKTDSTSNTVTLSGGTNSIDGNSSVVLTRKDETVIVKSNGIHYYKKSFDLTENISNILSTKANLSGATFSGNIFSPSITGSTFFSGSTPLETVIQTLSPKFFHQGESGTMAVQLDTSNHTTNGNYSFTLGSVNINNVNFGNILGGKYNDTTLSPYTYGGYSTIVNGLQNKSQNPFSFVGNGLYNIVSGFSYFGVIVNGSGNKNYGSYSTILNGSNQVISGSKSTIVAGSNNNISGNYSLATGSLGTVSSDFSSVLGGASNSIIGNHSSIVSGIENGITGRTSAILSGRWNQVVAPCGHIAGGYNNTITSTGNYSSILGGRYNVMRGNYSSIVTGRRNEIGFQAHRNAVLCGTYNVINSGLTNTSILAGNNITALSSNTAYSKGIVAIDLSANTEYYVHSTTEGRLSKGIVTSAITSGIYLPTVTGITNISSATTFNTQWMRVGNTVNVSGKLDFEISLNGAFTLGLSLPVASNFTAEEQCSGVAVSTLGGNDTIWIKADATNNLASVNGTDNNTSYHSHFFNFTYTIV